MAPATSDVLTKLAEVAMDLTYPACQFRPLLLPQLFGARNPMGCYFQQEMQAKCDRNQTRQAGQKISLLNACQTQCSGALRSSARYTLWHMSTRSVDTIGNNICHWLEHGTRMQVHGYASQAYQASKHIFMLTPGYDGGVETSP